MKITLQQIRDKSPCREGWTKLLKSLGNPDDMSIQVTIGQIAKSNGPQDALWCLRCADFDRRDVIRAILPSVKRVSIHASDRRVHDCINALEQWLSGNATEEQLINATHAAYAAYATAYAAYATARAAYATARAAYAACATARAACAACAADAAAYAANAARATEIENQIRDICEVFPC